MSFPGLYNQVTHVPTAVLTHEVHLVMYLMLYLRTYCTNCAHCTRTYHTYCCAVRTTYCCTYVLHCQYTYVYIYCKKKVMFRSKYCRYLHLHYVRTYCTNWYTYCLYLLLMHVRFYKKLKNVGCEYDRLNGWNTTFNCASCVVHQTRSLDVYSIFHLKCGFCELNLRYDY